MISIKTAEMLRKTIAPTIWERLADYANKDDRSRLLVKVGLAIAAVIAVILLVSGVILLNGFALSYLWSLFVAPVFGLPLLKMWQAVGIIVLLSYLRASMTPSKNTPEVKKEKTKAERIAAITEPFTKPLIFMAIGWVVNAIHTNW